jgi:long-chain acyl-CoA synthetase
MLEKIINVGDTVDRKGDLDKVAVYDLSGSESRNFTYRDIDQLANKVGNLLLSYGVVPGDKIAIMSENSVEYLSTFFGILRIGAVAVLVNIKLPKNQVDHIILESESKILFTDRAYDFSGRIVDYRNDFYKHLIDGKLDIYNPKEDHPAFILYTSGSFGPPKGAVITHKSHGWSVLRHVRLDQQYSSKRLSLICAPFYHSNGLTTIEGAFAAQSSVVLLPKFDAKKCLIAIENYKVNTVYAIPTMLAMMLQEKEYIEKLDLKSVLQIRTASSHINQKIIDGIVKYFPKAYILNSYGLTEVGPSLFGPHPTLPRPFNSVGYPSEGIEYRLVDGVLEVKSPSMMTAYFKENNKKHMTEDGYFITKDVFKVDENGFYYFIGRSDDMFKCGANSVYSSQIESILDSYPGVLSSFVVAIPDDIKGHKPYAFVVLEPGSEVSEDELKKYSLEVSPAYQHPRKVWFLEQMPLAGTNKVDKKKLYELAISFLANQK